MLSHKYREKAKLVKSLNFSGLCLDLVPNEIQLFPHLNTIDLSYNRLTVFPDLFRDWNRTEHLKELTTIDLSNNQIELLPKDTEKLSAILIDDNPLRYTTRAKKPKAAFDN